MACTWWCHQMEIFSCYWPFVPEIHRLPVNSPHKGQWRGALMFSLICAGINGRVNNREAGDLRCQHAHYDVTVMSYGHHGHCQVFIEWNCIIILIFFLYNYIHHIDILCRWVQRLIYVLLLSLTKYPICIFLNCIIMKLDWVNGIWKPRVSTQGISNCTWHLISPRCCLIKNAFTILLKTELACITMWIWDSNHSLE